MNPENDKIHSLITEFQDGVLSGFSGTYTCQLEGDAQCDFHYFGLEFGPLQVLDTDYENYLVSYYCDDTKYDGWRQEFIWVETRDQDYKVSIPDEKCKEITDRVTKTLPEF